MPALGSTVFSEAIVFCTHSFNLNTWMNCLSNYLLLVWLYILSSFSNSRLYNVFAFKPSC